ncbi:MAG: Re/Si-specific NAD(P)(+) transhydrogenase subunit alpha [Deltaproteobacteria bacterium]|nr:Re/Si-specific NAD(P)(+) transhydrogenase subunit alpha [Deltaproteobacteria bacterium]
MGPTSRRGESVSSIVGIVKESFPGEKRVAISVQAVKAFRRSGLVVRVETAAGAAASQSDEALAAAGAEIVSNAWDADVVLKVRPPTLEEVSRLKHGAILVSLVYPDRNPGLIDALAARGATVIALEKIPRITRAQKMDVLSSMANLAGYRAVIEAAAHSQGFFGPQVTAAGSTPPAKVLVIGAGVAGLAALGAARALGAEVSAFDTRAAAREQVESLGGKFLTVALTESGEGQGGYAKGMSPEFIAAEMDLFRAQAKEVDVIITTALVPGSKAPLLLPRDVVEALKPGSLVVDMAAEQGGNCELCQPGAVVEHNGVKIIGFTDLASRMASTATRFFAMNLLNLLAEITVGDGVVIALDNEVIHPALLLYNGGPPPKMPPRPAAPPPHKRALPPPPTAKAQQQEIMRPTRIAWGTNLAGFFAIIAFFVLGRFAPAEFLRHSTVFVLACFVGWQVVWSVTPALHTPLMSVTNAISGIIIIGGILQVGTQLNAATIIGLIAVLLAAVNIAGGFFVTNRMLRMFHRDAPSGRKGGRQ